MDKRYRKYVMRISTDGHVTVYVCDGLHGAVTLPCVMDSRGFHDILRVIYYGGLGLDVPVVFES
jgi:hypothetical protein